MLDHVDIGWSWLKDHLDRIIDEVNQNKPLPSSTIAIDPNTSGSMIRAIGAPGGDTTTTPPPTPADEPWRTTPDGETAGWHQIISFNPDSTLVSMQWVWGGTPKPGKSYKWVSVGLIDPSTCTQYTLIILTKP